MRETGEIAEEFWAAVKDAIILCGGSEEKYIEHLSQIVNSIGMACIEWKDQQVEEAKSIGEATGESCSVCGRANTWHPDCPTCHDIETMAIEAKRLRMALAEIRDRAHTYGVRWARRFAENTLVVTVPHFENEKDK